METITQDDFTLSFFALLEETFEKVPEEGGFYLNKDTDLLTTIEGLSAENASSSIGDNEATVASHVEHMRFYMTILKGFISQDSTDVVDWKESWQIKKVNEKEWKKLKKTVWEEYNELKETLKGFEGWDGKIIGGALAVVTHSAYHLGAIRQILKSL